MIIKKDQQAEVLSNFDTDSIDMTIDDSDKQVLMHILSTGLYQDPIGSLIRENVSNNLDATVEAGSSEPVIVGIKQDKAYNWYFYSQDFGTGISPDRMQNIVSKYAASTKRQDAKQKGHFGLGLKAGLAYTDSFQIITVYNNKQYTYLMYKGDDGSKIELLDESDSTERNGTTFKVYIKDNSYDDRVEFNKKIKEQLSYINNLYFDIVGYNNNYNIYKSEHWWYTANQSDRNLHIVLDGIYYPIDFNKLGIAPIQIPLGLKLDLNDGLVPTPSRESIIMSPSTKQLLLNKIKLVAIDLVGKYNENVTDVGDFPEYLEALNTSQHNISIGLNVINIRTIEEYSEISVKTPTFSLFKSKFDQMKTLVSIYGSSLLQDRPTAKIETNYGGTIYSTKSLYTALGVAIQNKRYRAILVDTSEIDKVKIEYLKETSSKNIFFYRYKFHAKKLGKINTVNYLDHDAYRRLLNLKNYPKSEWRDRITELQDFEKILVDTYTEKMSQIEIPEEWLTARREARKLFYKEKRKKEKDSFVIKTVQASNRSDWGGNYTSQDVNMTNVRSFEGLNIYDCLENKVNLASLRSTFKGQRISIHILAKCNMKKVEGLNNFITYDEFMKGDNRPFIYYATCLKIVEIIKKSGIKDIAVEIRPNAILIDPSFSDIQSKMDIYRNAVYVGGNGAFSKSILELAENNNLFNKYMIEEANLYIEKVKELEFTNVIDFGYYAEDAKRKMAISLCKEILTTRKLKKKKNPSVVFETEIVPIEETSEEVKELEEITLEQEII